MNLTHINIVLGLLLAVVIVAATRMDVDETQPNVEFLPEMKRSPAASTFSRNDVFPNGRTLQTPVAGTISRGQLPLHYAATKEDAVRAGDELQNPLTGDSYSISRGAQTYAVFCTPCHGPGGLGDGPVARRGFPPPPPLTTGKSREMKDGQLFHILTFGQGSMAPMAAQLSRERRWDAVNYVRSLQENAAQSGPDQPSAANADAEQATSQSGSASPLEEGP